MHGECWEAWIPGKQLQKPAVYFSFAVHPPWLLLSWLSQEWWEIMEGELKRIFLVLSGSASLTCCVDLFDFNTWVRSLEAAHQPVGSGLILRTRDTGHFMLSKNWRNVSYWEVLGGARWPGRQRSSILKVQKMRPILKICCVLRTTISAVFITEEAIIAWEIFPFLFWRKLMI